MSAAQNLRPWRPGETGNPGGRPKRLFPRVDQLLKDAGLCPIKALLELLPTLKERDQAQIWLEILPYVHAKVKPVDDGELSELEKLTTAELVKLVKEKLPEVEE